MVEGSKQHVLLSLNEHQFRRKVVHRLTHRLCLLLCTFLAIFPAFFLPSTVFADDSTTQQDIDIASNSVTDTENLLGSSLPGIIKHIATVHEHTGVTVKMLYIASFGDHLKPEAWAQNILDATQPAKNTVLMVVASQDGKMVTAISQHSDHWLDSQQSADKLSAAANAPLVNNSTPDWSASAHAILNEVEALHSTRTSEHTKLIAIVIFCCLALLLIGFGVFIYVTTKRKRKVHRSRHGY